MTLTLNAEISREVMIANVWHALDFFDSLGDYVGMLHRHQWQIYPVWL